MPEASGYIVEITGKDPFVVDMSGYYIESYSGRILPVGLLANAVELSNTEIAKIKLLKRSWDEGYQAGVNPTVETITQECPEGLDENRWLSGFIEGQKARSKANPTV